MTLRKMSIGFLLAAVLVMPSTASAATSLELQLQLNILLHALKEARSHATQTSTQAGSALGAPSCTLSATPSAAGLKDRVQVSWTSKNASKLSWVKDTSGKDNLRVPPGKVALNGSKRVQMTVSGNPSLTMKATGLGGSSTCSVTIPVGGSTVSSKRNTSEPVSCAISADKSVYGYGDTIRLTWSSRNASAASFKLDNSGKDTLRLPGDKLDSSGSVEIDANVIGNPVVRLEVLGTSGSASCSAKVRIED